MRIRSRGKLTLLPRRHCAPSGPSVAQLASDSTGLATIDVEQEVEGAFTPVR